MSGKFDAWLKALADLGRILHMPSARTIFMSPAVPTAQKRAALERLVTDVPPEVRSFLDILAERDRLQEVPGISEALSEMINHQRGIVTAEVTTAIPLDTEMERLLAQRLAAYLSRDPSKVVIRGRVDPAIIGGVVARVGDELIDDSVRGRLARLRRALSSAR